MDNYLQGILKQLCEDDYIYKLYTKEPKDKEIEPPKHIFLVKNTDIHLSVKGNILSKGNHYWFRICDYYDKNYECTTQTMKYIEKDELIEELIKKKKDKLIKIILFNLEIFE